MEKGKQREVKIKMRMKNSWFEGHKIISFAKRTEGTNTR